MAQYTYPTTFMAELAPLPAAIEQSALHQKGLYVGQGLTQDLAQQLVDRSREPHIVEYCPNDSAQRFKSVDAIKEWLAQGRLALPLVKKRSGAWQLVGFGWLGPKQLVVDGHPVANATITFSFRLYNEALGQGNALPYLHTLLASHAAQYGNNGVWLEAWSDNAPAIRTYQKAGFTTVAQSPQLRHGKMYTRIAMQLQAHH